MQASLGGWAELGWETGWGGRKLKYNLELSINVILKFAIIVRLITSYGHMHIKKE